jgi:hypothetical protein
MIKKFNDFKINEGFFDDVIRPTFDPYIHPDMRLEKTEYEGVIVDKRIVNKTFGGEKYIFYVKIPKRGVEKFTVNATKYYDYDIGDDITVSIEE